MQNSDINDKVKVKVHTVGITCENHNFSFMNVKLHVDITTPLLYRINIGFRRLKCSTDFMSVYIFNS